MDQKEVNSSDIKPHPNGLPRSTQLRETKVKRDDSAFFQDANIFPDTEEGKLLRGLLRMYLIKQEPRMGWAMRSSCSDSVLLPYPIETVAAHMWGLATLILTITSSLLFQQELPEFDYKQASQMALLHDIPELITGDFTPEDKVDIDEKHRLERDAMDKILAGLPEQVRQTLSLVYNRYEARDSIESKFVKDCDKLDFILTAFLYERQGFSYLDDFYRNTLETGFHTNTMRNLATTLVTTREDLAKKNLIFRRNKNENLNNCLDAKTTLKN